jgi:hypothetical protein
MPGPCTPTPFRDENVDFTAFGFAAALRASAAALRASSDHAMTWTPYFFKREENDR